MLFFINAHYINYQRHILAKHKSHQGNNPFLTFIHTQLNFSIVLYIKQSLINIIQNAIDSILEKSEIKNKKDYKKEIQIKLKTIDNYALIIVKDNGIGIKEDMLPKIFEPYFTTKRHGTGLGLTNVARIIEAHNGNINIESEYNKGAEVIIKLPLLQENQKFLKADLLNG